MERDSFLRVSCVRHCLLAREGQDGEYFAAEVSQGSGQRVRQQYNCCLCRQRELGYVERSVAAVLAQVVDCFEDNILVMG